MYLKKIINTLLSKSIILVLNFFTVILTTNLWGAEGRGIISILLADVAVLVIFNNVLGGSSIVYYTPKLGFSKLMISSYIWIIIVSLVGAIMFSIWQNPGQLFFLFVLTLLTSLVALNFSVFIGKENIKLYNSFSVLVPVLLIVFTLILNYLVGLRSVTSYIYGYILAQLLIFMFSLKKIRNYIIPSEVVFSWDIIRKALAYGWKNETSNFLQFLNYRFSYYLVLYYLGLKSVGVFSVGVAIAESIWVISRSISMVQYSKLVNIDDEKLSIQITRRSVRLSFIASVLAVATLLIVPSGIYKLVFGAEFKEVKLLLLVMAPGILSVSVSNIYGHFFAARNNQNVLIVKSLIGLWATIALSFVFIPLFGIRGASMVSSISYVLSSLYIWVVFLRTIHFSIDH